VDKMKFKFLDKYYIWQVERSQTAEKKIYPNFPKKFKSKTYYTTDEEFDDICVNFLAEWSQIDSTTQSRSFPSEGYQKISSSKQKESRKIKFIKFVGEFL
jgi:hypothetical protein